MNFDNMQGYAKKKILKIYNFINDIGKKQPVIAAHMPELLEIKQRAARRTTINEHLVPLFIESLQVKPKLIIELGVGKGESTFALERVAKLCGARLVSVDRYDRSGVCTWEDWIFIVQDDVEFGANFASWSQERGLAPEVDVLFIDTSHEYEHTKREIAAWFPWLSPNAKVFFHDTNLSGRFFRQDGSMGYGWDNNRGVIRAIEEFFGATFDEKRPFVDLLDGWLIKHEPHCCGFTVLHKIGWLGQGGSIQE
jgi:predicted O-methyltransferase YrrM